MKRNRMRWAAATLALAACSAFAAETTPPKAPTQAQVTPKVGMFTVTSLSVFNPIPKQLQLMDFWFPMPFEDDHQKIYQRFISAPYNIETAELPESLGVVNYMKGGPRGGLPLQVRVTFHVERFELVRTDYSKAVDKPATEQEKQIHERWTRPETLVVVDKEMKAIASKIVSGKKKTVERARAIYDHLVAGVQRVTPYELQGAGYGNAKFTVMQMKGNDMDMAPAFVGLCRALGIPARTVIGYKIPPGLAQGGLADYNSWAEFYLDGVGWVPTDPSEARKSPSKRAYYFGGLDERRVAISIGRDIMLVPPQADRPLNFWVKPYWEGDQKPMPDPYVETSFIQIDEIPGKNPPAGTTSSSYEATEPSRPAASRR